MKKRIVTIVLCVTLSMNLFSCGTEKKESAVTSGVAQDLEITTFEEGNESEALSETETQEATQENLAEGAIESTLEKVSWTKKEDFFLDVNQGWFDRISEDPLNMTDYSAAARIDLSISDVDDLLYQIFESGELEKYPESDPLNKYQTFYDQLKDPTIRGEASDERICEIIEYIESAQNISDIYKLMLDEDYCLFNNLLSVSYMPIWEDSYGVRFIRKPFLELYSRTTQENSIIVNTFSKTLQELSFDEETATRMAQNAVDLDFTIQKLYDSKNMYWEAWPESKFDELETDLPMLEIIKSQNFTYIDPNGRGEVEYFFLMEKEYIDFLEEFLVQENLEQIKDYYAVCAMTELIPYASNEAYLTYRNIWTDIYGIDCEPTIDNRYAVYRVEELDRGVLANYYTEHYLDPKKAQMVEEMFADLQEQMITLVNGIDWLSERSKEQYRFKVKNMKLLLGSYEYFNQYEDMVICDNVVDTAISMMKSNREFDKRLLDRRERYPENYVNLLSFNARYFSCENTIFVEDAVFESEIFAEDVSYEQQLAMLGIILGHEMGHGFDSYSFPADLNGKWTEFLSDEDGQTYYDHLDPIIDCYDGKTTLLGNTCNGYRSMDENFGDYLGTRLCLEVLAQMDDPSYEDFFIAYAQFNAEVLSSGYEKILLREDSHLPYHDRVDIGLAQFDQFYETFSLDESYPYYVPAEERYDFFKQ